MTVIKYTPNYRLSEATIQAEIYRQLVNLGYQCEASYKINSKMSGKKYDLLDLILVYKDNIVLIIEVKSKLDKQFSGITAISDKSTKQIKKYSLHGLPIYLCTSMEGISRLISYVKYHFPILG